MAIKKVQKNRLNENNEFDVLHYETEASVVLMADGTTAEETISSKMPKIDVTAADNGKFLRVVDGAWAAATIANAEEASF